MYYEKLVDLGIRLRRRSGQEKTTCPQCSEGRRNKKDPCLSVNITEGVYSCHNCGWKGTVKQYDKREQKKAYSKPDQSMLKHIQLTDRIVNYAKQRGISEKTLQKFMVHGKEEWMPQTQKNERCIVFPYIRNGEIVNAKYRDGQKNFKLVKDAELIFFGMQTLPGRHCALICEGEMDALALYEAGFANDYPPEANEDGEEVEHDLGRWAILSVPNGASKGNNRLEYLENCAEDLKDFDEFVIAVDNDEAGAALKDELIRRLGVEKCRFLEYPVGEVVLEKDGRKRAVKDANEILQFFGVSRLREVVLKAKFIPVSGIYFVEDIFQSMLANFRKGIQLAPTTRFGEMDDYFRWKKGDINLIVGYGNHGKALALDTLIPTPDGWKTMGDLKDGDKLFDETGNVCTVIKAHHIMYDRPCYKVLFSDGESIVCDEEHLWFTHTVASRLSEKNSKRYKSGKGRNQSNKRVMPKVRTTKEILDTLYTNRKNKKEYNHSIDLCSPIVLPESNLLIHPYLLGAWIGDGVSYSASFTCNDPEIIERINEIGYITSKRKSKFAYGIKSGFIKQLKQLNLIKNKHIPAEYLRSSINQRIELLRGLMDTDGSIDKNGICEFTTIKENLCNQVYELITSLGIKATIIIGDAKINGRFISKKYRICFKGNINPFYLTRKSVKFQIKKKSNCRYIHNIEKVDTVPVRCITVDSPNSLYLCSKSFIPTHNTFFWLQVMLTKSLYDGWKWAVFSPENFPANDFYDDLVEMLVGKWLQDITEAEYTDALNFLNEHVFYVYPEDEHNLENIHEKFRYLILKKGIDGVLVDPFNQLDKTQKPYERDDQYLSLVLKDVKRFALLNAVSYNIITHPKNPSYQEGKALPVVDMYDIAGGAMWGNKVDQIISYYRPMFHENKTDPRVQVHIQKIKRKRTGGKHGSFDLILNWNTKRYADTFGVIPCDPNRASKILLQEANNYSQTSIPTTEIQEQDENPF